VEKAGTTAESVEAAERFYSESDLYFRILSTRQQADYDSILGAVREYGAGGKALEYGCGLGLLSSLLSKRGYEVTGVDISKRFVETARSLHGGGSSVTFEVNGDVPLRFAGGEFDLIVSSSVLEHCTGIGEILLEFHRLLREGGLLFIETPNMLSPLARLKLIAQRMSGRRKHFHRFGTPGFLLTGTAALIRKKLVRKPEFIYVDPMYDAFSEADEDVSYLSNPLDFFYFLRSHGFAVLELSRNVGAVRRWISRHIPSIAGGVMIVARKLPPG